MDADDQAYIGGLVSSIDRSVEKRLALLGITESDALMGLSDAITNVALTPSEVGRLLVEDVSTFAAISESLSYIADRLSALSPPAND